MCHRFALKTVNKNPIWRRSFYLRYRLVTQAQYEGTQPMGRRRRPVGRLVCVDKFKSNHSLLESLLKVQYCAMPLGHLWAMPLPMLITTQTYSTGTVYHIVLYHVVSCCQNKLSRQAFKWSPNSSIDKGRWKRSHQPRDSRLGVRGGSF